MLVGRIGGGGFPNFEDEELSLGHPGSDLLTDHYQPIASREMGKPSSPKKQIYPKKFTDPHGEHCTNAVQSELTLSWWSCLVARLGQSFK